jgi:hypothetical protein
MAKTLAERIAERINQQPQARKASGKVAFLALKDEIAQAVQSGWPVKEIWQTLHDEGRVAVGYHAFNLYVNKYIREPAAAATLAAAPPPAAKEPASPLPTGFRINASPKKEDIV